MSREQRCREQAQIAADALKSAGYEVEHFDYIGTVRVTVDGKKYYIGNLPKVEEYKKTLINSCIKYNWFKLPIIVLEYEFSTLNIPLSEEHVIVRGKDYFMAAPHYRFIGHIHGNMHVSYENRLLMSGSFPEYINDSDSGTKKIPDNVCNDILDKDTLRPVKPQMVDIINVGTKMVKYERINESNIRDITVIGIYIVDGKFRECADSDLFKYERESDGQRYAMLFDQQTGEASLVNSTDSIKLIDKLECEIKCENGLYCGYKITSNLTKIVPYLDRQGLYLDFHGNETSEPVPRIYYHNYTFFGGVLKNGEILYNELEARDPNSGMCTKIAL
jgi:hypothetical protein